MKRLNKYIALLMGGIISVVPTACTTHNRGLEQDEKEGIQVSVSIVPQATFVKEVCGDLVEVNIMVPPGSSPTNYEPTPEQIQDFSKSEVYFSIGVPTEEANILPNVSDETEVVALEECVSEVYPDRQMGEGRDPHIWLSPKRAKVMVQEIVDKMCEIDGEHEKIYRENAKLYIAELEALDASLKAATEKMATKKFIVFHPAFGYLAEDYGLEMYALEQGGKEATVAHLIDMTDFAKQEGIEMIFYQAEIDSSQSQAFADEIGGKTAMLAPLSPDYIENMEVMIDTISQGGNNE